MKIDMSRFKKVSSDKDSTLLRHDDGHQIKIAHKALSHAMKKQLDKLPMHEDAIMAKGGKVDAIPGGSGSPAIDPEAAREIEKGATSSGWRPAEWKKNLREGLGIRSKDDKVASAEAEGGEVKPRYAEGTPDHPVEEPKMEAPTDSNKPITINIGTPQQQGPVPQALAPGAPMIVPPGTSPAAPDNQIPYEKLIPAQAETAPEQEAPQAQPVPESGTSAQPPVEPQAQLGASPTPEQPSNEPVTPTLAGAYQQQLESNTKLGEEQANLAHAQENQFKAQAIATQDIHKQYQDQYNRIDGEIKNVIDDIKTQQIDPNRFMGSMDTDRRIQTALGLALSGFGSSLTGGPNQALDFINKQIDRDIDAQKADLGKKNTLLSAYMHEYGNLRDAENMARVTLQAVTQSKLQQAEATAQQPIAKVRAQQLNAALQADMAPKMQQQALNMMLMQAGAGGTGKEPSDQLLGMLRVANPQVAKEIESRYVPTVGMAKIPVPDPVRDQLFKRSNLVKATDNLIDWTKKHGGTLNPKTRAEGEALAAELQQIYRQGVGASTSQEEQHTIEGIINSKPGAVLSQVTTSPRLKALKESMNSSLNTLKEQYGLPKTTVAEQKQASLPPQQQAFVSWAKANPNDPRAKLVLKKLGLDE